MVEQIHLCPHSYINTVIAASEVSNLYILSLPISLFLVAPFSWWNGFWWLRCKWLRLPLSASAGKIVMFTLYLSEVVNSGLRFIWANTESSITGKDYFSFFFLSHPNMYIFHIWMVFNTNNFCSPDARVSSCLVPALRYRVSCTYVNLARRRGNEVSSCSDGQASTARSRARPK